MAEQRKDLDARFETYFESREELDAQYWKRSEELQNEYDALMKELEELEDI